ncbi:MAG: hypothetical protein K2X53_06110 [Alphaproteobacteria bacterium]|nr:hypothetical protein [Alphaproteobacteria bacterium]
MNLHLKFLYSISFLSLLFSSSHSYASVDKNDSEPITRSSPEFKNELKEKHAVVNRRLERLHGPAQISEGMGKVDPLAREKAEKKMSEDVHNQWLARKQKLAEAAKLQAK